MVPDDAFQAVRPAPAFPKLPRCSGLCRSGWPPNRQAG